MVVHAAAGLAAPSREAVRLLRAAEGLCRAAVASLAAVESASSGPPASVSAAARRRRRRRGRRSGAAVSGGAEGGDAVADGAPLAGVAGAGGRRGEVAAGGPPAHLVFLACGGRGPRAAAAGGEVAGGFVPFGTEVLPAAMEVVEEEVLQVPYAFCREVWYTLVPERTRSLAIRLAANGCPEHVAEVIVAASRECHTAGHEEQPERAGGGRAPASLAALIARLS